jgi:hypothetical protein
MKRKILSLGILSVVLILCTWISIFHTPASGQVPSGYAIRIYPVQALPASCNPANGSVVALVTGAGSIGIYNCQATNTWIPIGTVSNQYLLNQGTLTASKPFISHTATWNNAAVNFEDIVVDITNTASAATSTLFDFRVGGASLLKLIRTGTLDMAASLELVFDTRSRIHSTANGLLTVSNNAGNDFTRLNLGTETVTNPAISVSPAVAGQTQGVIITKGDGTNAVFANLGAAANGSIIYCADCQIANPCVAAGTGAIAKRLNGAWVCN